jgi:ABC-type microcin C transport system permease subunit YejE
MVMKMVRAVTADGVTLAQGDDEDAVALSAARQMIENDIEEDVIIIHNKQVFEVLVLVVDDWTISPNSSVAQRRVGADDSQGDFKIRFIVQDGVVKPAE